MVKKTSYAKTNIKINGKHTLVGLNQILLGTTRKGGAVHAAYKDRNGLHNWRANLRLSKPGCGIKRSRSGLGNSSGYQGVSWNESKRVWEASIGFKRKKLHLGFFDLEEDAARAYNKAAKEYFAELAALNDVPDGEITSKRKSVKAEKQSGFRGVNWQKSANKWMVVLQYNGKALYIGHFDDPVEAAKAYNEAALRLKGEKAKLNVIE